MNFKKVVALSICAAMVAGMSASTVMAADMPEQFKDLKANEAYEFPMMVKSFQATYWDAAQEGMKKAAEELGVTYTAQGPNSESDIADQVNMINTAIAANPVGIRYLQLVIHLPFLTLFTTCVSQRISRL